MCLVSIHAPRAGGDENAVNTVISGTVSIHAPRAGGDFGVAGCTGAGVRFNPRPPRGGRHRSLVAVDETHLFQSTPPARGATAV